MRRMRPRRAGISGAPARCLALLALALAACAPVTSGAPLPASTGTLPAPAGTATLPARPTEPSVQPTAAPASFGPDAAHFPPGINPLSGQPVADPELLKVPALLISISHFPVTARPQAGLSFAPIVYEFSITGGETRHLAAFYGEYPAPEIPVDGNCDVREGAFVRTSTLLGNRVWMDANRNGLQDQAERGIGGICVELRGPDGSSIAKTTTDSNGYYGFNVQAGRAYSIRFIKPDYLTFTQPNIGDEDHDSDADPRTGIIDNLTVQVDDLGQDAGMFISNGFVTATPNAKTAPKPQVGPVRSGRLLYGHIANYMTDSCLIYAFASSEVLPFIPKCSFVAHEVSGGGYMLEIDRMKAIAEDNMQKTAGRPFDYASNLYADTVPQGGKAATQINEFWATLNQSAWTYDPLYGAYLRYVDKADKYAPGILHPEVDRLTGRQLHFENVIVLTADTDVVSPTNLNIRLDIGNTGYAYLFRDGQMFPIRWSTRGGDYEQKTGLRRPIQFLYADGTPAPLKPGHTWITIVTPFSTIKETEPGVYFVAYAPPEGEAR